MEIDIEGNRGCWLDARFFYVHENGRGRVTSDFVRQVASRHIRTIKGTDSLLSPNFENAMTPFDTNRSILGYQVEWMILSHIHEHGLSEVGSKFKKIDEIYFFHGKCPKLSLKDETALYIPRTFNYRAVDGIFVHRGRTDTGREQ